MKRKYGEYLPEGTCVVLAGKECRISGAPLAETTECILYPAELLGPGKLLSGFALMEGGPDAALQGPYILGSGAGTFQKYVSAGEAVIARRGRKEKTVRGSFALLDHVPQKLRPLRRKKARDGFDVLLGCSILEEILCVVRQAGRTGTPPVLERSAVLLDDTDARQPRVLLLNTAPQPEKEAAAAAGILLWEMLLGRACRPWVPAGLAGQALSRKIGRIFGEGKKEKKLCDLLLHAGDPASGFSDLDELQQTLEAVIAVLREEESTAYNAFISYHHTPETIAFARKLQTWLENYRAPGSRKGEKKPFARVFLDKNELACVSDLREELERQLKRAEFLIVLCSGKAAATEWVNWEITTFLSTHAPDRIVPVICGEGEVAFPEALKATGMDYLAADFSEKGLKSGKTQRKEEFNKIIAAKLRLPLEEVTRRHKAAKYRKLLAVTAAAAGALLLFSAYALTQNRRIAAQYEQTLIAQSRYLAQISSDLLSQGDRVRAVQTALAALPSDDVDRPLVTEAYYALSNAMYAYRDSSPMGYDAIEDTLDCEQGSSIETQVLSPDGGLLLTINDLGQLYRTDLTAMEQSGPILPADLVTEAEENDRFKNVGFVGGDCLLFTAKGLVLRWEPESGTLRWQCDTERSSTASSVDFLVDELQDYVLVDYRHIIDLEDGSLHESDYSNLREASLSPDGEQLAFTQYSGDSNLYLMDIASGKSTGPICTGDGTEIKKSLYLADDSIVLLRTGNYGGLGFATQNTGALECWDLGSGEVKWTLPITTLMEGDWGDAQLFQTDLMMEDGSAVPLLVCGVGRSAFFVLPESGELVKQYQLDADVCRILPVDGEFYAVLKNGRIMRILSDSDSLYELIHLESEISCANYDYEADRLILGLKNQAQTVVLKRGLSDSGVTLLDCSKQEAAYYAVAGDVNLRVTCHENEEGGQSLWAWDLLSTEPLAQTDWDGRKTLVDVTRSNGQTILWYSKTSKDSYDTENMLYGWNVEENRACAAYPLTDPEWSTAGMDDRWFVYKTAENGTNELHQLNLETGKETCYSTERFEGSEYLQLFRGTEDENILMVLHCSKAEFGDNMIKCQVDFLNLETGEWVTDMPSITVTMNRWNKKMRSGSPICASPDDKTLAIWEGDRVQLLDRATGQIFQTLPIDCSSDCEFTFLNDDLLVVWGDNHHLTLWDISKAQIVQEDRYTIDSITYLTTDPDTNTVRVMTSEWYQFTVCLYRYEPDRNTFERYLSTLNCMVSHNGEEAFAFKSCGFYQVYSLEDLIAKANDYLHGRELSETDRIRFYLENARS